MVGMRQFEVTGYDLRNWFFELFFDDLPYQVPLSPLLPSPFLSLLCFVTLLE